MQPVSPVIPGENIAEIIVAEHQPEYGNLPVIALSGGVILSRWKLSEKERLTIAETGDLYLFMHTFGKPVTPVMLQVERPEIAVTVQSEPASDDGDEGDVQFIVCVQDSPRQRELAAEFDLNLVESECAECQMKVVYSDALKDKVTAENLPTVCVQCADKLTSHGVVLPETQKELERVINASQSV